MVALYDALGAHLAAWSDLLCALAGVSDEGRS